MRRAFSWLGSVRWAGRVLFVARPQGADALGWSAWNRPTAPVERLRARAAALLDAVCAALVAAADRVKGVDPPPPSGRQKRKEERTAGPACAIQNTKSGAVRDRSGGTEMGHITHRQMNNT